MLGSSITLLWVCLIVFLSLSQEVRVISEEADPSTNVDDTEDGISLTFDLVMVIDALQSYRFRFSFWDPIHDNITITRIVDLTKDDLTAVAISICSEYIHGELGDIDHTARIRCLTSTLLKLRLTKQHAISLISRRYEEFPFDEEVYTLLTAYDDSTTIADNKQLLMQIRTDNSGNYDDNIDVVNDESFEDRTACITGTPTAHSILPALFTKSVSRILVFSSIFDFDNSSGGKLCNGGKDSELMRERQAMWNFFHATEAATALGKTIQYIGIEELLSAVNYGNNVNEEGHHEWFDEQFQCSVIQLNNDYKCENIPSGSNPQGQQVIELLTNTKSTDVGRRDTTVVVLEYKSSQDLNRFQSNYLNESKPSLEDDLLFIGINVMFTIPWFANTLFTHPSSPSFDDRYQEQFIMKTVDPTKQEFVIHDPHQGLMMATIGKLKTEEINLEVESQHNQCSMGRITHSSACKNKRKILLVITSSNTVFTENMFGLAEGIASMKHDIEQEMDVELTLYIAAEMNLQLYTYMESHADLVIHIPLSVVDLTLFAKHSVVYNSEQTSFCVTFSETGLMRYKSLAFPSMDKNERHMHKTVFWSFDDTTGAYIHNVLFNNLTQYHIPIVPYIYSSNRKNTLIKLFNEDSLLNSNENVVFQLKVGNQEVVRHTLPTSRVTDNSVIHQSLPSKLLHVQRPLAAFYTSNAVDSNEMVPLYSEKDIAVLHQMEIASQSNHQIVLFMGTCFPRRAYITAELERLFIEAQLMGKFTTSSTMKFYNICGSPRIFDYLRDYYLLKAKIVINLSSTNTSVLETHRINYLLSLGKVIISEEGIDKNATVIYRSGNGDGYNGLNGSGVIFVTPSSRSGETDDDMTKLGQEQATKIFDIAVTLLSNDSLLDELSYKAQRLYEEVIMRQGRQFLFRAINHTFVNLFQS